MKKIVLILLIIFVLFLLTSCQTEQLWYLADATETTMNTITVRKTDQDHLHVKAECINGVNTGCFEEDFTLITENLAVYSGRNYRGYGYTVILNFSDDKLKVDVKNTESATEAELLWFGDTVKLSGKYSLEKPDFEYINIVIEKVFHSDMDLAQSVESLLGEEEYAVFVHNFGMSTSIYEEEVQGHKIIKGRLNGLGDWCGFYSSSDGYFYGVYDHRCFSNDPVYQNNPPAFLSALY
ncbi:MAG: hypothetical protein IJH32_07800 [Ruminococcus sp.]|nr:hypothetical protein [Ruminococcus sp.]